MLARDHRSRTQSFERTRSLSSRRHSTSGMERAYQRSRSHDVDVQRRRTVSTEFINKMYLGEMGKRKETKYDPVTFNFDISGLLSESLRKSADNLVKSKSRRHITSMIEIPNDTSHQEVSRRNLRRNTKSTEFVNSLYLGEVGTRRSSKFDPVAFRFDLSSLQSPPHRRNNLHEADKTRSLSSRRRPASVSGTSFRSFSIETRSMSTEFVNSVDLGEIGIRRLNQYDPVTFRFDLDRMSRSQSLSPERKKPQFPASQQIRRRDIYGSVDQIPDSVKKHYNKAVDKYQTKLDIKKDKVKDKKSQPYKDTMVQSESLNEENSIAENESIDSQSIAPFNHLRHFWETGKWKPLDLDVSIADDHGDLFPLEEINPEPEFQKRTGGLFFIERKTKRARHQSESSCYRGVKVRKVSRSKPDDSLDKEPRKISLDHREGPTFIEIQSSKFMELTADEGIQCEDAMQLSQHSNTLEVRVHGRTAEEGIQCDDFGDSIGQISNLSLSLLDLTPTKGSMIANKSFDMSVDAGVQCDISDKSFAESFSNDASGLSFMEIQSSKAGLDTTEIGIQISDPEHVHAVDRAVQHEGFDHLVQEHIERDFLNPTLSTEGTYKDSSSKLRPVSVTSGTQYEINTSGEDIQDKLNMAFIQIENCAQQRHTISQGVQAGQADLEENHSSSIKIMPSTQQNFSQLNKPFSSSLKVVQDISDSIHSSGLKIVPSYTSHSGYLDTQMHSSALKIVPSEPSEPVRLSTVSQGTQFDDWESVRELDISHDSGNFMFLEISSAGQTSSLSNLTSVRYTQSLDEGLNRLDPSESSFISENEAFELQFFRPIVEDKTEPVAIITEGTQWDPEDFGGDAMEDHLYSRSLEFLQIQSNTFDQESDLLDEFDNISIHDISGEIIAPEAKSPVTEGPVVPTTNEMSTQSDKIDFSSLVTSGTQYDLEKENIIHRPVDSVTQTETEEKENKNEKILVSQGIQAGKDDSVMSETGLGRTDRVHDDSLPKQTHPLNQTQSTIPKERQIEYAGKLVETPDVRNTQTMTTTDGLKDRQQNVQSPTEKISEHKLPEAETKIATSKQHSDKEKAFDENISLSMNTNKQLPKQSSFENLPSMENIDYSTTDPMRRDSLPFESLRRERQESEIVTETFQELQFRKPEDSGDLLIGRYVVTEHYVPPTTRTVSDSEQKTDQNITSEFRFVPATKTVVVEADGEPEQVAHEVVQMSDHPDIWQGFAHEKVLVLKEEAENYEHKPDSKEAIKTVISDLHTRTMGNIRQRKTVCLTPVQVRIREIPDVEHLSDEDLDGVEANVSGVKKKVSRHVKFTGKWGNKYKEIERNRKHRGDYNHDDDDNFDYDNETEGYSLVDQVETGQINERLYLDRQDSEEGYEPLKRWPSLGSDKTETIGDNDNDMNNKLEIREDSDLDDIPDQWNQIDESQQHVDSSEFSEPSEIELDDTEERFRDVSTDEDERVNEIVEIAEISGEAPKIITTSPDQWDLVDETRHKYTDTDKYGLEQLTSVRGEEKEMSKDSKGNNSVEFRNKWGVEKENISQESKIDGRESDEANTVEVSDTLASKLYADTDQVVISHHKILSDSEAMFDPWEWEVVEENPHRYESTEKDRSNSTDVVDQITSGDSDTTETGSTIRDQWAHQGDDLDIDVESLSPESRSSEWVQIETHIPDDSGEDSSEYDTFRESDDESFQEIGFSGTPNRSQEIGPSQEDIVYEENRSIGESFESYDTAEEDSFHFDPDEERELEAGGSDTVPEIRKEEVDELSIKSDEEESTRVFRIVEKESKGDILGVNILDDSEISSDAFDEEKYVAKGEALKSDKQDSDEESFEVPEVKMATGEYDDIGSEEIRNFDTIKGAKSNKTSVKNTKFVENVKERKLKQGESVVKETSSKSDAKTKSVENVKEKRNSGGKRLMKRIVKDDPNDDDSEEYYYDSSSEFGSEDSEGFCRTPVSNFAVEGTESIEERPVGETAVCGREKDQFEKKEAKVDRVEVIAPESMARVFSEMLSEGRQEVNVAPSRLVDDFTSDSSELDISFPESRSPEVVSPEPEVEQAERLKKPDAYEFIDVSDEDTRNLVKPSEVDVSSVEAFGDTNLMKKGVPEQSIKHTENTTEDIGSVHSDSTVDEWVVIREPEGTLDQSHRTREEPDAKDAPVDTGKVKMTPLSSRPSTVSSTSELVSEKPEKSEIAEVEAETKKQNKQSAGPVVSIVAEPETDFRKVKLKPVSKPDQTKTEVDTDQLQHIKGHENQDVDSEITERSDGKGEKSQIRMSEIPETFISPTNRKQRMTKQEGQVGDADTEIKQKINREEIDAENELQRIKLKTNVKRYQADNTDEGYSIRPHEPQRGVKQRITTWEKIQSESESPSENYIEDILDEEDVSVDNQSTVSNSLNQSTKSSSATKRELSPVPVPDIAQVKLRKTDLIKRQIPQREVEFPDLQAGRFIRNDANENIEKVTMRKVTKSKTNADTEGKEVESKTEGQAIPPEAIPPRESNSTAEESAKQKMEKIRKATGKIPEGKREQHSASMQEKVQDIQKLQLGRASLLNTAWHHTETPKVESKRDANGALHVKAYVPKKTEETTSESSSSRINGRTSPVQEPFSVASSSPRRRAFSPELEPVPHIERVKLRKTGLIKTKPKKEELEATKLPSKGMHEVSGIDLGKASEKGLDMSTEDNDSVEKYKDPITTVEIHRTQLSTEGEVDKEPEERLKALPGGNADQKPVMDSAPKKETDRDAEHNKFIRASERDENEADVIRIDIPRENEEVAISTSSKSEASSSSSRRIDRSPEPEPVPHIEQVKLRQTGLIKTKTKKDELEETSLQMTALSGNERGDSTKAINPTIISNEQTPSDSKVKDPTEKGRELKSTAELSREKSSAVNEVNKHLTEKPKTSSRETAKEMHDEYPELQKETDRKPQEFLFGRVSLRKTGLALETLEPKSQREENDKPKPEDKKETKLSVSEKTDPLELKSISPLSPSSPEPVFMEEVNLRKTGFIKRNTEQEELKAVDSLERMPRKNEAETMNLRTVSKNETCEDEQEKEIAHESEELSEENKKAKMRKQPGMREEREAKEEQVIKQGRAALRKTGLDIGKLKPESQEQSENDRPKTGTEISKIKEEGTSDSSGGAISPPRGLFQLKSVTSSSPKRKEILQQASPHIEQVKLRRIDSNKRGIQKEELENIDLQQISEKLNDGTNDEFHPQNIQQQETVGHATAKETSSETQNVEKDQPLTCSTDLLSKERTENDRPTEPLEDDTVKPKEGSVSLKEEATELELVTLKPVSRSQSIRDQLSHTDSSKTEDKERTSFKKGEVQKYSSQTQRVRKETKESDTSKQKTKESPTEFDEDAGTRRNESTSSSSAVSRQTSPSPEPLRLKSLTPRPSRPRERSPEPVPHIQQVKLKKTSIVKREIPKEELGNVDLQETMYGVKDNEESGGMIKLKNVPKTENASSKVDKDSVEYSGTEIKFDDLPDRSKSSFLDFERQSVSPVKQEQTDESEHGNATRDESSQDPDKGVAKDKYQRGDKKKEDEYEDKTKIVLGKGKLVDEHDTIETVVLKPVPVLKSVAATKKGKEQPEQKGTKPMFDLKPRARRGRIGDGSEKRDVDGKGTFDRETLSKTVEIAEIPKEEDKYNRQSREKGKDEENEEKRKLSLGKVSLKLNLETEETVILKPIPTTQTFKTDGEDQNEYEGAALLKINGTQFKSQPSVDSDDERVTEVETRKGKSQRIFKVTEKTKDDDKKIQMGKGSVEDDKHDFENVTLRPVPKITVLSDVDDDPSTQLSSSPFKLHSEVLGSNYKGDTKAEAVITQDVTHKTEESEIVMEHVKQELSAILVDESTLDPIAVKSVIESSDPETFSKEIDQDTNKTISEDDGPRSEYEPEKLSDRRISQIDVVNPEMSTGKGRFKNKFYQL